MGPLIPGQPEDDAGGGKGGGQGTECGARRPVAGQGEVSGLHNG